jgi:hypothetical protein
MCIPRKRRRLTLGLKRQESSSGVVTRQINSLFQWHGGHLPTPGLELPTLHNLNGVGLNLQYNPPQRSGDLQPLAWLNSRSAPNISKDENTAGRIQF